MPEIRVLANENISPKTVRFLKSSGLDAKRITDFGKSLKDLNVIEIAKKENRIILTFDLDFGEIFYRAGEGKFGVWVLRIKPQTVEQAEKVLTKFINSGVFKKADLYRSMFILSPQKIRGRYVK